MWSFPFSCQREENDDGEKTSVACQDCLSVHPMLLLTLLRRLSNKLRIKLDFIFFTHLTSLIACFPVSFSTPHPLHYPEFLLLSSIELSHFLDDVEKSGETRQYLLVNMSIACNRCISLSLSLRFSVLVKHRSITPVPSPNDVFETSE